MSEKDTIAKSPKGRVSRTPIGTRNVLTVAGKEPGYQYRIVNDEGDRVQRFIEAGYELVEAKDVKVGDKRINSASSEGSKAQAAVGGGMKAFVMRIKDEWYKEDQEAKQRQVNEIEGATKPKAQDGTYGNITFSRD